MSEHTKGPMTVGFDGPSRPIILAPNNVMLSISKFEDGRWTSYDEENADCHLFAVALELLEALKKSRQLASIGYRIGEADMRGHDKIGERYGKQQDELMAVIDAAIARAEVQ